MQPRRAGIIIVSSDAGEKWRRLSDCVYHDANPS